MVGQAQMNGTAPNVSGVGWCSRKQRAALWRHRFRAWVELVGLTGTPPPLQQAPWPPARWEPESSMVPTRAGLEEPSPVEAWLHSAGTIDFWGCVHENFGVSPIPATTTVRV